MLISLICKEYLCRTFLVIVRKPWKHACAMRTKNNTVLETNMTHTFGASGNTASELHWSPIYRFVQQIFVLCVMIYDFVIYYNVLLLSWLYGNKYYYYYYYYCASVSRWYVEAVLSYCPETMETRSNTHTNCPAQLCACAMRTKNTVLETNMTHNVHQFQGDTSKHSWVIVRKPWKKPKNCTRHTHKHP